MTNSNRETLEKAYHLAEGYLVTGQFEAASRLIATLLTHEAKPNYHHLRLLLEEIVEASPVASAQVSLATILLGGDTGEREPERAVGLLQEVIDRDDGGSASDIVTGLAHELLADCHISGSGLAADPGGAFHHLMMAAELGRPKAAFSIAVACHQGLLDQAVDLDRARDYYRLAADGGEAAALTNLALIELDQSLDAEDHEALELLEQARALGDARAGQILDELAGDETDE